MLFYFYLNEVLTDLADLRLECKISGLRVNVFCYADDIELLAHTENALQFMLDTLTPQLENLSLKINVESLVILFSNIKSGEFQLTCCYKVTP